MCFEDSPNVPPTQNARWCKSYQTTRIRKDKMTECTTKVINDYFAPSEEKFPWRTRLNREKLLIGYFVFSVSTLALEAQPTESQRAWFSNACPPCCIYYFRKESVTWIFQDWALRAIHDNDDKEREEWVGVSFTPLHRTACKALGARYLVGYAGYLYLTSPIAFHLLGLRTNP